MWNNAEIQAFRTILLAWSKGVLDDTVDSIVGLRAAHGGHRREHSAGYERNPCPEPLPRLRSERVPDAHEHVRQRDIHWLEFVEYVHLNIDTGFKLDLLNCDPSEQPVRSPGEQRSRPDGHGLPLYSAGIHDAAGLRSAMCVRPKREPAPISNRRSDLLECFDGPSRAAQLPMFPGLAI